MEIDPHTFYREAARLIYKSLEMTTLLHSSFLYIREALRLPAAYASIVVYNPDVRQLILLAVAHEKGALAINDSVDVPEDIHDRLLQRKKGPGVTITETLEDHPLARLWVDRGYTNDTAQISLPIQVQGYWAGSVNFCAQGKNPFTPDQARMIALLEAPFSSAVSNAVQYRELFEARARYRKENRFPEKEPHSPAGREIIGKDRGMWGVMEMVHQVAPQSSPVLLLGETGTGKELVANTIHTRSPRQNAPFIKVNCGAIPDTLMDSELFGHEKGAFTGAISRKQGRFERAHTGTLFLDEVGELSPEAQIRLLRVLQEKEIERVGGEAPVKVDVRIIAATHRNLADRVQQGKFREDLYFRLNVFPISIPPLRKRRSDILPLAQHFIEKKALEMGIGIYPPLSPEAHDILLAYHWPGNVRELENAVERALILSPAKPLTFDGLTTPSTEELPAETDATAHPPGDSLALDDVIARHIRRVLAITGGKVHGSDGAAALLKIHPSTLRSRMEKLKIPFGRKAVKPGPESL